jgi:hypothetical protein
LIQRVCLTVFALALLPGAAPARITLNAHTTVLIDPREPGPIQMAAKDLGTDLEKVFNAPVRFVHLPSEAGPVTICIAFDYNLPPAVAKPSGWERLHIQTVSHPWPGRAVRNAIILTGSDVRGAIYAIYQFSQQFLGVDPLYWWTDHAPRQRSEITLEEGVSESQSPLFHYRGLFLNDEDLLTGWAPGEKKDKTGISLAVWNRVYEAILRLKGDMVAPGTWIFPDDPQVKFAAQRGLIVTQHHAIPLGLNVARWPQGVPYNYTEHPEILERAWKDAVNSYLPHQEVVWSVGLRGLSDVTYASIDPSVRNNNKALGQLISKAIAAQIGIVRAVHPDAVFVTNLWQEGARLVQQGELNIPPEVVRVWADGGYGYLQDHGEVAAGQGAYDHVAMMNGRANQLTEMVPVERSFSELGRYVKAGATEYFLVNTSDIRPVVMSIRAVMDLTWKGLPGGAGPADQFYRQWSAEEFGEKAAPQLAALYKDYFNAPAHFGTPVHEYGDQLYHTEARRMMLTYMIDSPLYAIPSQSPKWAPPRLLEGFPPFGPARMTGKEWLRQAVPREIQQCADAQPRWDAVWKKALAIEPLIPPARRPFYNAQVLAMIAINRQSNQILYLVSKAIQDAENGRTLQAREATQQALRAFNGIQQAEAAAEYGKWKNWYRGDWLTGVYRTHQMLQTFAKFLDDPLTHISPPVLWDGWEAYYHNMHYEGDRSAAVK